MPSNLNALIRYKTIDRCLRNKYIRCDIRRLQEACAEALGEARGRSQMVSERTIREDIRVMRSEMLEFNAPIICEDGYYRYSDTDYSIFNVSLNNKEVIRQVMSILWTHRNAINNPALYGIIETLGEMIGVGIGELQTSAEKDFADDIPREEIMHLIASVDKDKAEEKSIQLSLAFDEESKSELAMSMNTEPDTSYTLSTTKYSSDLNISLKPVSFRWGDVLRML